MISIKSIVSIIQSLVLSLIVKIQKKCFSSGETREDRLSRTKSKIKITCLIVCFSLLCLQYKVGQNGIGECFFIFLNYIWASNPG